MTSFEIFEILWGSYAYLHNFNTCIILTQIMKSFKNVFEDSQERHLHNTKEA